MENIYSASFGFRLHNSLGTAFFSMTSIPLKFKTMNSIVSITLNCTCFVHDTCGRQNVKCKMYCERTLFSEETGNFPVELTHNCENVISLETVTIAIVVADTKPKVIMLWVLRWVEQFLFRNFTEGYLPFVGIHRLQWWWFFQKLTKRANEMALRLLLIRNWKLGNSVNINCKEMFAVCSERKKRSTFESCEQFSNNFTRTLWLIWLSTKMSGFWAKWGRVSTSYFHSEDSSAHKNKRRSILAFKEFQVISQVVAI